nr:hypothetical protein [Tanacetum cinerariifolium]
SVGSSPTRVILFGDIPTVIPSTFVIAPETSAIAPVISSATLMVEMTLVASPTGLCGLVPYSDSDSDSPDEMDSPEYITPLLATSPFSYTDSFEAFDSSDGPPSQDPYTITVAQSSSGDSSKRPLHSSSHSAGPSHKRCRSSTDSVPSSTPVTGSLAPTRADLLLPRKRFRDSYSSETSMEEDTEIDTIKTKDGRELDIVERDDARDHVEINHRNVKDDTEEHEADTSAGDMVEVGIDPMSAPVSNEESEEPNREDSSDSSGTRDGVVRSFEDMPIDLDDAVPDLYHYMSEVRIDMIVRIEMFRDGWRPIS